MNEVIKLIKLHIKNTKRVLTQLNSIELCKLMLKLNF